MHFKNKGYCALGKTRVHRGASHGQVHQRPPLRSAAPLPSPVRPLRPQPAPHPPGLPGLPGAAPQRSPQRQFQCLGSVTFQFLAESSWIFFGGVFVFFVMRRVSSVAMKCWELRVVDLYLCKLDALSNIRSAECLSCIAGITVQESMQQGHVFIFEARKCRHFGHELYIRYNKLYIYMHIFTIHIELYIYIYMYSVCMMLRKRY